MANVYTDGMCCHRMENVEVYGVVDGVNKVFHLLHNITPGTLRVYLNGIRLTPGLDYNEIGTATFEFVVAPLPAWPYFYPYYGVPDETSDFILADYIYESSMRCGEEHWVINEIPEGVINNINTDFTTKFTFATVNVYLNGDRQAIGRDFVITGSNTFRMIQAPLDDFNGKDRLLVDYIRSAA